MVYKCAVGGCPNYSDTVIHYILPEEPVRRSRWLRFIERSSDGGERAPGSSRVCGEHFSREHCTRLDLGSTTRLILRIDAVPTIYPSEPKTTDGIEAEAAVNEEESEDACNITISSTVSLASIKEEPFEHEVSSPWNVQEDSKSPSIDQVKQEESEFPLSAYPQKLGSDRLIRSPNKPTKRGTNCSDLELEHEGSKDKPFSCSQCGAKFRNKGVLMQHESGHMDKKVRTYRCSHCGKAFAHRAFLKAHQKLHVDMGSTLTYSCTVCSRQFQYKGSLNTHMKQHSDQETNRACQCPVCDEVYQYKVALYQHFKTLHGKSRISCKICSVGFWRLEAYFKHMDRHVVVTPYYCSLCKVYQVTKRGYQCHMRIHEKKRLLKGTDRKMNTGVENAQEAVGSEPAHGYDSQTIQQQNYPEKRVGPETELGIEPVGETTDATEPESQIPEIVVQCIETGQEAESILDLDLAVVSDEDVLY